MDDIQDNATVRRGEPPAYLVYGVPKTINCIGFTFFQLQEMIAKFIHPEAIGIYTEQMMNIYRGQGVEISWSENSICPTEVEYYQVTSLKSASFLYIFVKWMQLLSHNEENFNHLMDIFGMIRRQKLKVYQF